MRMMGEAVLMGIGGKLISAWLRVVWRRCLNGVVIFDSKICSRIEKNHGRSAMCIWYLRPATLLDCRKKCYYWTGGESFPHVVGVV